ncbi:MAG: ribose 5-phosphate isomerase B [Bacteroidia bacterium]|nr:ribose 5-phosphate isomerase B [Bacteroidia bacterium]
MNAIAIASDHAGFEYKEAIKLMLENEGYAVMDFGTNSTESCDYPDYAHPLAEVVAAGNPEMGIVVCGSGNGVCMTVNKHAGVRGALAWNEEITQLARQHNDANVLCLPARFISIDEARSLVQTFLNTPFEGGRHARRAHKIG